MNNLYKTTDMRLATVLSLNFPIQNLINNDGKGTFVFEKTAELEKLIAGFYNKELSVEPSILFNNLKSIKDRLYATVKEQY
ncbi:MAG: DUF5659 domain-containing protein [Lutibacter sp.]|jgi:hypothetical protein